MKKQGLAIEDTGDAFLLSGELNEFAEFSPLLKNTRELRLDLRQVQRFNSIGIRNFLHFLTQIGDRGLTYEHCPAEFIDQINMIPALLGPHRQGKISSLYAPYSCPSCDHEQHQYGTYSSFQQACRSGQWPTVECTNCGTPMELLIDSFFSFVEA